MKALLKIYHQCAVYTYSYIVCIHRSVMDRYELLMKYYTKSELARMLIQAEDNLQSFIRQSLERIQ